MSRPTASELRWPMDDESRQQATEWAASVSNQVLSWTWQAFDVLHANVLSCIDLSQPLDQLERDLTSKHFVELQRVFADETEGLSSIVPHHEFPENESAPGGSGRPPASDISFVWYENQRVSWPIEAKVLKSPSILAPYLGDTMKFKNGTAAPFVGEGAQIAYILEGTEADLFSNLQAKLSVSLHIAPEFATRAHRVCLFTRDSAPELRLHHLAMCC